MSGINVKNVARVFLFKGLRLPDPNPKITSDEVRKVYCTTHPELINAKVSVGRLVNDQMEFEFEVEVGHRG